MSDSEAFSLEFKRIPGTVKINEDFHRANGEIWSRNEKPLCEGGYSQVYLYENGRSKWAVKRIASISGGGRTTSAELEKEKAALIKFSERERFVRFIGWFAHKNIEYFALEYVELGDLEENLTKREEAGGRLPEAEVKTILTQILEGIEFMHAEGYIHRDLKPQNILVAQRGPDWQIKITDLGLSKCTIEVLEGYSFTGTPPYMAPEIYGSFLGPSDYTNAIDIWAVGCITCRMLTGKPPFSGPRLLVQYIKAIKESKPLDQLRREVPYIQKPLAELLKANTLEGLLVRQLLEPKPRRRPSAKYAKGHPWLQGLDLCILRGHERAVTQVAFSPSGRLLASASQDCTIRLWSPESRKTKHILESPGSDSAISFLRDCTLVASRIHWDRESRRGLVMVYDTTTGKVKQNIEIDLGFSLDNPVMTCSPDGSLVAAILENDRIELWDTEKGERKQVFPLTEKTLGLRTDEIGLSSNGELMVLTCRDGTASLMNMGNENRELMFKAHPGIFRGVTFSSNSEVIALASYTAFWLWDNKEKEAKRVSEIAIASDKAMTFSLDGKLAVFEFYSHEIRIFNTGQKEETHILKGHSERGNSLAFSPKSPLLASASEDKTVRLWNTEKGKEIGILTAHSGWVFDVAFSPNGEFVATASADGTVGLWNVSQWEN